MDIHGVFTGSGEAEDLGPSSIGWSCMAATGFIYCGRTYDTEPDMCKSRKVAVRYLSSPLRSKD